MVQILMINMELITVVKVNYTEGQMYKFAVGELISEDEQWLIMYDKHGKKLKLALKNIDTVEYD